MNFDPAWLFLSLVPSGAGFVLVVYGKKQGRWPHLVAGLALAFYPYVVSSLAMLVAIGLAIGIGLWWAVRLGW
jgi:hypothetical protein